MYTMTLLHDHMLCINYNVINNNDKIFLVNISTEYISN